MAKDKPTTLTLPAGTVFATHIVRPAETCARCGKGDRSCHLWDLGRRPTTYHAVLCIECANAWDDCVLGHKLWRTYEHCAETLRFCELYLMGGREYEPTDFYAAVANVRAATLLLRELARDWVAGRAGVVTGGDDD